MMDSSHSGSLDGSGVVSVSVQESARLPRIADGQHLPLVTVGFIPVDVAELRVDTHVHRPAYRAAIGDSGRLDALKNGIELLLPDTEAEVVDRKVLIRLQEVEGQSIVDVDGRKGPGP